MPWVDVIWNYEEGGNVAHIAEHGVTPDEVREVLENPIRHGVSSASGNPMAYGVTAAGRAIAVMYEEVDGVTVYPITAYELE